MPFEPNKSRLNALIVTCGLGGGLLFAVIYIVSSVYFAFNVIFVIPPNFKLVLPFREGLASVVINDKWGYIDKTSKTVIPPQFESATSFRKGVALVKIGEELSYINRSGQKIGELGKKNDFGIEGTISVEESLENLKESLYLFDYWWRLDTFNSNSLKEGLRIKDNGKKCGYINRDGSEIIELKFNNCQPSSDGLIGVNIDGKWGYIRNPLM